MRNYYEACRQFPPSCSANNEIDSIGWRVLLAIHDRDGNVLGCQEASSLYPSYVEREELLMQGWVRYSENDDGNLVTHLVAIEGDSILASNRPESRETVTDGLDNTLIAAESSYFQTRAADSRKPTLAEFLGVQGEAKAADRFGEPGDYLLFADGEVAVLKKRLTFAAWKALWTPRGNDSPSRQQLVQEGAITLRY